MGAFNEVLLDDEAGTLRVQFKYAGLRQAEYRIGDKVSWLGTGRPADGAVVVPGTGSALRLRWDRYFAIIVRADLIAEVVEITGSALDALEQAVRASGKARGLAHCGIPVADAPEALRLALEQP